MLSMMINQKNKQRKKPQKTNKKSPKPPTFWPNSKANLYKETVKDILKIFFLSPYSRNCTPKSFCLENKKSVILCMEKLESADIPASHHIQQTPTSIFERKSWNKEHI